MINMPNPEKIRALAIDLDGTLLAPGAVLTDRARGVIHRCIKKGLQIIIATGRAVESAERFRAPLGAEGPMIYFNGALIVNMPENELLKITLLDREKVEFCADLSREMNVHYQVFLPGAGDDRRIMLLSERDTPEREMYYKHTGVLSELVDLKEFLRGHEGCIKSMFLAEPEVQAVLREKLDKTLGNSVYITQTLRNFLEVMDADVSKGKALEFVMKHLSLKNDEVMAFGDEENDIPMLDAAGFSVVPSSAKDAVKAKADLVTASNAEDGVAAFLEDFFKL